MLNKIIVFLLFFFLLFPVTVYASENDIQPYVYNPSLYPNSDSIEVEFLGTVSDFFVSICLKHCYDTGFLDSDSNCFIFIVPTSKYCYPSIYIYKNFSFISDGVYSLGNGLYRYYDTSSIFSSELTFTEFKSGSANRLLFYLEDIRSDGNTSPYKYYSTKTCDGISFRELPSPMGLEKAYTYYFKQSNDINNITFVDFSETNKILNNIFVVIVFVAIYGWFLNPLFKILNNIMKGE